MPDSPLAGRGIVITRPLEQSGGLAALVEAAGARALVYPAVGIETPADPAPALRALGALESFDLAVFVSPTAVRSAFGMMAKGRSWPGALRAAAVGAGSARELERHGVRAVLVPLSGADSEALLALPEMAAMSGKRVLILRGEGGRELLGDTLKARGAQVEYAECYRRTRPRTDIGPLLAAWDEAAVHAVTVSSAGGLSNLIDMLGERGAAQLRRTPVFVAHRRVAEAARRHGVTQIELAGTSDEEMLARLMAYFSHR